VTFLFFAAILPSLFWDKGPETAPQLQKAGIAQIAVPAALEAAWKDQAGFAVRVADPPAAIKLTTPGVQFRVNEASATRSPWVELNGWQFLRKPSGRFIYDAPGPAAALCAAEAFLFGADAVVKTDAAGLEPLGAMLAFLGNLPPANLPEVADIGFVDDGSEEAGEAMKLLTRRNLLFRIVKAADARLALYVPFGSKKYPKEEALNPGEFSHRIRAELTDEKRSLRIYGSDVVIGRLSSDGQGMRLHLVNYAGARRPVPGIRVRVFGSYSKHTVRAIGLPGASLADFTTLPDATEFTVPEIKSYAVIDLSR
jgi:hypothetical protein